MNDVPTLAAAAARLSDVLATYLAAVDAGNAPDRTALLAQHPALRSQLEAFFAADDALRLEEVAVGPFGEGLFHVVAVQHATAEHEGRQLDVSACQRMRIDGGRIVEVRGHYSDQRDLDNFWR